MFFKIEFKLHTKIAINDLKINIFSKINTFSETAKKTYKNITRYLQISKR